MKRKIKILVVFLCLWGITNVPVNAQINNSFVSTYWFTGQCGGVGRICKTDDNGFAFTSALALSKRIDSSKYKIICCSYTCPESLYYKADHSLIIHKCDSKGKIQWAKNIMFHDTAYTGSFGADGVIKETNDKGFIVARCSQIIKTDKNGKVNWDIYFDRDSIPGIKKTNFLLKSGINDIYECNDGSFIALLDASFSLLKISKEGKPLWLKSTVFDEFSPMYFDNNSEQKQWFEKSDSIGINKFIYNQGGGVYIPTYNVYETDDGGYMAIGKNEYRNKEFITNYTDSNKVFFTTKDTLNGSFKRISIPRPEKIYRIRKYTLTEKEKNEFPKQSTTVVVRTDKNGTVLWTKQFGNMSYDTHPHSDLIKLANGKWLVRIRDCDSTGLDNWQHINYGSPHSEFYILDNDGNIISEPEFAACNFLCDPWGMALAPDSGYYFYEQCIVSKADKDFCIKWQKGFGGSATDVGTHAVTADTGVLSTEYGIIYKFDKYGNLPLKTCQVTANTEDINILGRSEKAEHIIIEKPDGDIGAVQIKRKGLFKKCGKKIRYAFDNRYDQYLEKYMYEKYVGGIDSDEIKGEKIKGIRIARTGKRYLVSIKPGIYDENSDANILDISDTNQVRALYLPFAGNFSNIEIADIEGYREIMLYNIDPGRYKYKMKDDNNKKVIKRGSFRMKK